MLHKEEILNQVYSDQSISAVKIENDLFFGPFCRDFHCSAERKSNVIYLVYEQDGGRQSICLRGDNLITRKQMYLTFFPRKEYLKRNIQNDGHIYSFILMPHIEGAARCQLNSKRATVRGYHDNPFVFLSVLEQLFKDGFKKEENECDAVEVWIVRNKSFWEIFKDESGNPSFSQYLNCFCLNCFKNITQHEKYRKAYDIFWEKNVSEEQKGDWESYELLLELFMELRKAEIVKRISDINAKG